MNQSELNQNFRWFDDASFKSSGFEPSEIREIRNAFAGIPQHIRLNSGDLLYRFQQKKGILTADGRVRHWWLPIQGVNEIRRLREETKLSFEEVVRATAGLAFDFQGECNFEFRARLVVRVYAFMGPISRKPLIVHPYSSESRKRDMNPQLAKLSTLSGRLNQLFVRNLNPADLSVAHWPIKGPSGGFSLIT